MITYEVRFNYAGYISATEREVIEYIKAALAYSEEQAKDYLDTLDSSDIEEIIWCHIKGEPKEIEFIDTEFTIKAVVD